MFYVAVMPVLMIDHIVRGVVVDWKGGPGNERGLCMKRDVKWLQGLT